jgi:hypothetical protein
MAILTHLCNSKKIWAKLFLLKYFESYFIQNMSQAPSKSLKQWIKVDKLDYFKNASFEKFFLFWVSMNI